MSRLSRYMKDTAVKAGLCRQHTAQWNAEWSKKDLIQYYVDNPDWCLERKYPTLDTMVKKFKGDDARSRGVYIDEDVVLRADMLRYIFNNCHVGIKVANVTRLYMSLDTKAKVVVESTGRVFIDCYDDTELEVEIKEGGRATIYQYGSKTPKITGSDNYKIRDKR